MSQQLDALREFNRIPVLSSLSETEVFDFIRSCRVRRIATGETLFRQGEAGRSMFIIGEGGVDVFLERDTGRERVARLGAREVVGELSLLDPAPRSATVVANAETTVYEVLADDFDVMLRQNHPAAFKVARGVAALVCRRIRSANTRIELELGRTGRPASATGDFATASARPATGAPRQATTGARAAVPRGATTGGAAVQEPRVTGAFKRVLSRFWGGDE